MAIDWYKIGGSVVGAVAGAFVGGPIGLAAGATVGYFGTGEVEKLRAKKPGTWGGLKSPFSAPPPQDKTVPSVKVQPPAEASPVPAINAAAVAMNTALVTHGYKLADQPLYMAFQRVAGLTSDGLPGPATMNKLFAVLKSLDVVPVTIKTYPWSSSGGYDGTNAPTMADWTGNAAWAGPPPALSETPLPAASQVAASIPMVPGTKVATIQDVQRALNTLKIATPPLVADNVAGPKTKSAVIAFQKSDGLQMDGVPGPLTMTALENALSAQHPSGVQ